VALKETEDESIGRTGGKGVRDRLEHGDIIPDCIEKFAEERKVSVGQVIMIGGIGEGQVVVGPRRSSEMPPEPMLIPVDGAHEVMGAGVIAPTKPVSRCFMSMGR